MEIREVFIEERCNNLKDVFYTNVNKFCQINNLEQELDFKMANN